MSRFPTLVMIAGYGRSGSTAIDALLARRYGGSSLGEIRYLMRHVTEGNRRCSCGESYDECELWGTITSGGHVSRTSVLESWSVLSLLFMRFSASGRRRTYPLVRDFYTSIAEGLEQSKVIVDSSKTAWGALLRPMVVHGAMHDRQEVRLLGVFREPAGVLQSMRKGRNERLAVGDDLAPRWVLTRLFFGWTTANFGMLASVAYFRFRGDTSSIVEVARIDDEVDLLPGVRPIDSPVRVPSEVHHVVGGNRLAGSSGRGLFDNRALAVDDKLQFSASEKFVIASLNPFLYLLRRLAIT